MDIVESDEIPESVKSLVDEKRSELIEHLAEGDDILCDLFLNEQPISPYDIASAIRRATVSLRFTPVFIGSAIKNTGIQPLLDGLCAYLPNPAEVPSQALDTALPAAAPPVPLVAAREAPLVGLAFKLEEGRYGQLTYMRVYQGTLKRGGLIFNARTGKKVKVPRLVRMHSDEMEDVESIGAGEICAMFGVECSSGDTFTDGSTSYSMVGRYFRFNTGMCLIGSRTDHASDGTCFSDLHVCSRTSHLALHPSGRKRIPKLFPRTQPFPKRRSHLPSSRGFRISRDHHFRYGRTSSRHLRRTNETRVQRFLCDGETESGF